ncbi:MAG: hypothetical protein ACFFDI_04850 [Promethearchaeota archaeon]
MSWSPPRKTTVIISFLVVLIGLVIGALGFLGYVDPILPGMDTLAMLVGLIIAFIGWFLLFLGVKMTNF